MARSAHPDSAGSQFFICLPGPESPNMQYLNGKYTAFGQMIKGEEALAQLENVPVTVNAAGEPSKPVNRQEIESIKIVPGSSIK